MTLENRMVVGEYRNESGDVERASALREARADTLADDPRTWERDELRAAIAARAELMTAAAREQVAAETPRPVAHPSGYGYHFPADPVWELMADFTPSRDAAIRCLLRAAASTGAERARLMELAMDCAQTWADRIVRRRAWDMAEAA